jgi:hypothetical protein
MRKAFAIGLVGLLLSSAIMVIALSQPRVLHDVSWSKEESYLEKLKDKFQLLTGIVPFYADLIRKGLDSISDRLNNDQDTSQQEEQVETPVPILLNDRGLGLI